MNTIIEKIRAEVNRQAKSIDTATGDFAEGRRMEQRIILSVLSDLEKEEKPMNPNEDVFKIWGTTEKEYLAKSMDKVHLEMEIATYLKDWEDDEEIGLHLSTDNGCITIELDDIRDLARHFAKWQKEQMISALKNDGDLPIEFIDKFHEIDRTAFQNGQENMKEQMMKEAVEGYISATNEVSAVLALPKGDFNKGDKVRIIIVKED